MYVCVTYYCVIGCRKEGGRLWKKVTRCVSLITELLAVEKKAAGCGRR